MGYGLSLVTAATEEPLRSAQVKRWCRIDTDDDDETVTELIAAARERAEIETGRQLITATWSLSLDYFPRYWGDGGVYYQNPAGTGDPFAASLDVLAVRLPRPPLQSLGSISYFDTAGVSQTLSPTLYQVDLTREPARVRPAYGQIWPTTRLMMGATTFQYTAGYGGHAAVPPGIKLAMRLMIEAWYQNREDQVAIPIQAVQLLSQYSVAGGLG